MAQVNQEEDKMEKEFQIKLTREEKIQCLEEIKNKLKKILFVYERSLDPKYNYNYKVYVGGIAIYTSSSNLLFKGELVNIIINLNSILTNNFEKDQIKRLVLESVNFVDFLLKKYNSDNGLEGE